MPGNGHGSNGGMARRSRERKEREETAAIGYVAAKKQEEMEAAAVGLRTNAHCKCDNNRQLIDLKKALDNNLLTQEEHDLQRSRVLGTEIVEPVVVKVAIAPRVISPEQIEMQTRSVAASEDHECKRTMVILFILFLVGIGCLYI